MSRYQSLSSKKPLERHMLSFQWKWFSVKDVFNDFLIVTVYSFANNNELWSKDWFTKEREKDFDRIMNKYKSHWLDKLFASMLIDLMKIMGEEAYSDYLWEFYTYFVTGWENGQYFTPTHICKFMAQVVWVTEWESICDPTCWSGRTLLAACEIKKWLIVTWIDIDRRCAYMSIINLFLYSITWTVYHWDALRMEMFECWRFSMNNWMPVLFQEEITKEKVVEVKEKIDNTHTQNALFSM